MVVPTARALAYEFVVNPLVSQYSSEIDEYSTLPCASRSWKSPLMRQLYPPEPHVSSCTVRNGATREGTEYRLKPWDWIVTVYRCEYGGGGARGGSGGGSGGGGDGNGLNRSISDRRRSVYDPWSNTTTIFLMGALWGRSKLYVVSKSTGLVAEEDPSC